MNARRWFVGALALLGASCALVVDLDPLRGPDAGGSDAANDTGNPLDGGVANPLLSACVAVATCEGVTVANCFEAYGVHPNAFSSQMISCVTGAHGDCSAIAACVPLSSVPWDGGKSITCNGNVLSDCEGQACTLINCPVFFDSTSKCMLDSHDAAVCATGSCSSTQSTYSCVNGTATVCDAQKGVVNQIDCARDGYTCLADAGLLTFYPCTATGASCTGSAASCSGDTLLRCSGGALDAIDCTKNVAGGHCLTSTDAGSYGDSYCGTATACTQALTPTCSGSAVVFCAGGAVTTVDCTALGFKGCSGGKCF